MRKQLVSWQWQLYAGNHTDRVNLVLHLCSAPLFIAGLVAIAVSPVAGLACLIAGIAGVVTALIVQGRGHRREATAPVPFAGAGDFVSRFFVEQLVTFPRFVISGGWLRAWRGVTRAPSGSRDASPRTPDQR